MSKDLNENFFSNKNYLDTIENMCSHIEYIKDIDDIQDFLKQKAKNVYKVMLVAVNEIKFGYYNLNCDNKFTFPDEKQLEEKYILKLRLFNLEEEFLLEKDRTSNLYEARFIQDKLIENNLEERTIMIDDASSLFGEKEQDKNLNDNFVKLKEYGRKISMIIPVENTSKYYALVTRSYIDFDKKTGQAGIAYYRYLDIRPQEK